MYQAPTQIRPPAAPNAGQPATPEIPLPPEPQTLEQTGLTLGFLSNLPLKRPSLPAQLPRPGSRAPLGLPSRTTTSGVLEFSRPSASSRFLAGAGPRRRTYQSW